MVVSICSSYDLPWSITNVEIFQVGIGVKQPLAQFTDDAIVASMDPKLAQWPAELRI